MIPALLLATAAGLARQPSAPADVASTDAGVRPRFSAGASFAFMQVAAGSRQRDESRALGLFGAWRPHPLFAALGRYQRAGVEHEYTQVRFDSAYHRLAIGPEARLPIGRRFDFAVPVLLEATWLRSSLWSAATGESERSRAYLGVLGGLGAIYRLRRVELRLDVAFASRDERVDRMFGVGAGWLWR